MATYDWPPSALSPNDRLDQRLEQCAIVDRYSPDLLIAEAVAARTDYLKLLHDHGLLHEQDLWLPLGPSSLLSSQAQHNLELAGRVLDLKLSADGLRAYIATDNGGVWYTSDSGRSWSPLGSWGLRADRMIANRSVDSLTVNALDVHFGAAADQDVVYAATGDPRTAVHSTQPGTSFRGMGVLRLDGSVTSVLTNPGNIPWKREGKNLTGLGIYRLSHDPTTALAFSESGANTLIAAASNGLYERSGSFVEDADWTRVSGVDPFTFGAADGVACTDVLWTPATTSPARPARLWVALMDPHGGRTDVYVSSNGTAGPFQRVNLPGRDADGRLALASAPGHPEVVYILGKQANHQARVWRVDVDTDLTARVVNNVPLGLFGKVTTASDGTLQVQHDQADYDLAITVASHNPDTIYVGGSLTWSDNWSASLFKLSICGSAASNNFQANFWDYNQANEANDPTFLGRGVYPNVHVIVYHKTGIWVGCDGGVFAQSEGTMQSRNSGLAITGSEFVDSHPTLDGPVIAGVPGLGRIERVGDTTWRLWGAGDGGGVSYHANKPSHYLGQRNHALWEINNGSFTQPVLRTTGSLIGITNSERRENEGASLYSSAAVAAGVDGKARIAIGSNRVWFSNDWDPDAASQVHWVTLPTGTDPRASGTTPSDSQDILSINNNADWVVALKWSQLGTETDGRFDGQRLLVLTHQMIRQFSYDAAHNKWNTHIFTGEKVKNRITTNSEIPDNKSSQLPRLGQWTDIAPHDPARGSHGSFYVSTTSESTITAGGTLQEADKMDTLWWFDGTGNWYPTGLRNTAANTSTGTGGSKAPAFAVICDSDSPNTVYVGNAVGVWRGILSFSGSTPSWEWRGLLQGLPLAEVRNLSIHANGSLKILRATLQSRGIWELDISATRTSVGRTFLRTYDLDTRRSQITGSLTNPLLPSITLDLAESPDIYVRAANFDNPWGSEMPTEGELFLQIEREKQSRLLTHAPGLFETYVMIHHRQIQPLPASEARVLLLQRNDVPDDLTTLTLDLTWRQAVIALFNGTATSAPAQWQFADATIPIRSPNGPIDARTPRAVLFNADLNHAFVAPNTTDSCLLLAIVTSSADPIALEDLNHPNIDALLRNSSHVAAKRVRRSTATKSIHIDIGWTFSTGNPAGKYDLQLGNQKFSGSLVNGQIRIDGKLLRLAADGKLKISITNGPAFESEIKLGLPAIQTAEGVKQRLTNLGFYAGTDGLFDERACWAIRAFKKARINSFSRNSVVTEDNSVTQAFLLALQSAYSTNPLPGDSITGAIPMPSSIIASKVCGLLGSRVLRRSSFTPHGSGDDTDPSGNGANGTWEHKSAKDEKDKIAGAYQLHLRAFEPGTGSVTILNRVNLPQHIHMAQLILFELGFWVVRGIGGWATESGTQTRTTFTPDGGYGRHTEWAVREFQSFARMSNAAMEDVNLTDKRYLPRLLEKSPRTLSGRAHLHRCSPISGALNEVTRDALQFWADQQLRCPVLVYASTDNSNPSANGSDFTKLTQENIWRHDDSSSTAPRMYAIDWSGNYTIPATHGGNVTANGETFPRPIVVGEWTSYLSWNGPVSLPPRHTWEESEMLPLNLTGSNWASLNPASQSTFRVVRATSEVECLAFFDSVNAYDNAFISVGPCHWTLGIANSSGTGAVDIGELCGYLAYLKETDETAFNQTFGKFDVRADMLWNTNGASLFRNTKKYAAWLEHRIESGTSLDGIQIQWQSLPDTAAQNAEAEANFFKTWHWFYRWVMAGRTIDGYRRRMWYMARIRLRDILNTPWGAGVANAGGSPAKIGDVFTSERAVAMIQRLHIRGPAWVISSGGNAGPRLTGALTRAKAAASSLNWSGDPSTTWTNDHETALINGITAELAANASTSVQNSVTYVRNWAASWGANPRGYNLNLGAVGNQLDDSRNSFTLDAAGLPPAPP